MSEPSATPNDPGTPPTTQVGLAILGSILMLIGVLVMGFSGVCSGCVLVSSLDGSGINGLAESLPVVLPIGGVPFVLALGVFFAGRAIFRSAKSGSR